MSDTGVLVVLVLALVGLTVWLYWPERNVSTPLSDEAANRPDGGVRTTMKENPDGS